MPPLRSTPALALAFILTTTTAYSDEESSWRLFASDHSAAIIHAFDVASGQKLDSFPAKGPARLYASESGRAVFAVQGDAGVVTAVTTGISVGDHSDLTLEAPRALESEIAGNKPVHFVDHHGEIALFFDGEGLARIIREKDWLEGKPVVREVRTSAPHHGVAAVFGSHVLISEPHPQDPSELPVGIRVIDGAGMPVGGIHECRELHGEASSGNLLAIACAEGLLIVESGGKAPAVKLLAYPDTLPEGKTTTLIGGRGLQYFLGNFGASAVAIIDPTEAEAFRLVELPTRRVHFAVDPVRAKFAYVMTEDGDLHRIDVLRGEISDSISLTEPYSMDGHWNDPRPRIAVAGEMIVVTDPLNGMLHLVNAETFAKSREIKVEGTPFNIVAVGGSGAAH